MDSIDKEDAILAAKYLNVFSQTLDLNPTSNFIRDFTHNLAKWIIYSYNTRSSLSQKMIEFWRTRLTVKISGKYKFNFFGIERIPVITYRLAEQNEGLRNTLVHEFSIRLKEIAQKAFYIAQTNESLSADANFENLIYGFWEFSELVKLLITQSDYDNLKIVLNDVKMMQDTFKINEYSGVQRQVTVNRARRQTDHTDIEQQLFAKYLTIYKAVRDIEMIRIGNLYWLYFQVFNQKTNTEIQPRLTDIITLLEQQIRFDESLELIIYLYNKEDNRLLWEEWIWQGEERLSGKAYTLPGITDIIASGFAITTIRQGNLNLNLLPVDRIDQLKFLLSRTRDYLNSVLQFPDAWTVLLNLDQDALVLRVSQVFQSIDALDNRIEENFANRLAATPIAPAKVEAFKEAMQQQWDSSRDLMKVFETFKAIEVNPIEKLIDVGDNVSLTRGKVMFVDGELYSFIYGMEFGNRVNQVIESRFAEKIKTFAETAADQALPDIFDKAFNALSKDKFTANVIFVDMALFYTNERALTATGRYLSGVNQTNPYDFKIAGFFDKEIPIITVRDYAFQDLIVVSEIAKGLAMQQRQEDEYYKQNLIIEINEVTEEKANEAIEQRGNDGRPALSVTELMTAMHIHVHQILDFKIIEPKAVKVYKSTLENYGR